MFSALAVHASVKAAIASGFGYKEMTKTQAEVIPKVLAGKDLLVKAQTGSGKTLSFLVPAAHMLASEGPVAVGGPIRVLVVSPSRVLVNQSKDETDKLLAKVGVGFGSLAMIGGEKMGKDVAALKGRPCDVLMAAPGRLQDHIKNTPGFKQRLAGTRIVVLDEADRLLSPGFLPQMQTIFAALPPVGQRQMLLYSATLDEPGVMKEAAKIVAAKSEYVEVKAPPLNIASEYVLLEARHMLPALHRLLVGRIKADPSFKALVFFNNVKTVVFVGELLKRAGLNALQLHSDVNNQEKVRDAFRAAKSPYQVLLASNVASFGMDFADVSTVVQVGYTRPDEFIQRMGRTGRAGKRGEAFALLCSDEAELIADLGRAQLPAPISESQAGSSIALGITSKAKVEPDAKLAAALASVEKDSALRKLAERAYKGTAGYYNSAKKALKWTDKMVLEGCQERLKGMGLKAFPKLSDKLHLKV